MGGLRSWWDKSPLGMKILMGLAGAAAVAGTGGAALGALGGGGAAASGAAAGAGAAAAPAATGAGLASYLAPVAPGMTAVAQPAAAAGAGAGAGVAIPSWMKQAGQGVVGQELMKMYAASRQQQQQQGGGRADVYDVTPHKAYAPSFYAEPSMQEMFNSTAGRYYGGW